jgi:hypothetical protein
MHWGITQRVMAVELTKVTHKTSLQLQLTYLLTYSLTHSLTPWCKIYEKLIVTQLVKKYPAFLWNPKVHHRVHKSLPLESILSQPNPVRPIDPYLPKVHLNVIFPPTPRSSQWSLAFGPPNQNPENTSPLPRAAPSGTKLYHVQSHSRRPVRKRLDTPSYVTQ